MLIEAADPTWQALLDLPVQLVSQLFCTCPTEADRKVGTVPVVLEHGGAVFCLAALHFHATDDSEGWAAADAATELDSSCE